MFAAKDLALPAPGWPQPSSPMPPNANLATRSAQRPALNTGFAELDHELLGGGWPRGELIELLVDAVGSSEVAICLPALTQLRERSCLWVLPGQSSPGAPQPASLPFAKPLTDCGIDAARQFAVSPNASRECWWALETALRSRQFGAIMAWLPAGSPDGDFRALRRLQGLAALSDTLCVVIRSSTAASAPSPASVRLHLAHTATLTQLPATLLRRRGRALHSPLQLLLHSAGSPHLT